MQLTGGRVCAIAAAAALLLGSSPADAQPAAPSLGMASSFTVLGGSSVTSTGSTRVTGNLGVSPGTTVAGFTGSSGGTVLLGAIYRNDALARDAQRDSAAAYRDLASRACDHTLTDLGDQTLTRGVYCVSSTAVMTGELLLDAKEDRDAVWIFEMKGPLRADPDSSVRVINGGYDGNVFWQVAGSATLGQRTAFVGSILAHGDITLGPRAGLSGRALTQTGAVTLDTNEASLCCGPITLTPTTLPDGIAGTPYSQTLTAAGGVEPYTLTAAPGSLPPELTLSSASGVLSGTPKTACGSTPVTFAVTATDARGCSGTRVYTITISGPATEPLTLASTLPDGAVGVPYSAPLASGGSPPYTIERSGSLPPEVDITFDGRLKGTPPVGGCSTFRVTVTDACGNTVTREYSLVICPVAITFSPDVLPSGSVGIPYTHPIAASGCTGPYTLRVIGDLPPGLNLPLLVSGTPTTAGPYTFTVEASGAHGCTGTHEYTIEILPCPTIVLAPLPDATACTLYSHQLQASGGTGPYTFRPLDSLPPELDLTVDGLLSGIPKTPGCYTFTITVTDSISGCSTDVVVTLCVICKVTISPAHLPPGKVGNAYSRTLTACGGMPPYTFTFSGSLPPGLSLASSGVLSGAPTTTGCFNFTVRATDSLGCVGERSYRVCIVSATGVEIPLSHRAMLMLAVLIAGAGALVLRRS